MSRFLLLNLKLQARAQMVLARTIQFAFVAMPLGLRYRRCLLQLPEVHPKIGLEFSEWRASWIARLELTNFTSNPAFVAADIEYARAMKCISG